jgi:anti-sigma regulatory factor (Ser/Thr protein kinase)
VTGSGLQLALPAKAENVAIARHAVAGLAEALDMDPGGVADLKTVVTEACMNVVVHAYGDEGGPLEVEAHPEGAHLVVIVRDHGVGIRPLAEDARASLRLGLPLIAALSSSFELSAGPDQGTQVKMRMALSREGAAVSEEEAVLAAAGGGGAGGETLMAMPAGDLLAPVLSRVISILAARANFSIDRLSDAVLLGDAISSQGPEGFLDGTAQVAVEEDDRELRVRVGPLAEGGGERLLDGMRIPEIGGSVERLADEISVVRENGREHLLVRIEQPV